MWWIAVGVFAFLLFYIYDLLQLYLFKTACSSLFFIGIGCLILATSNILWLSLSTSTSSGGATAFWITGAVVFCIILFYTLFFALPYDTTYKSAGNKSPLITDGVYALCRHPGILWFCGIYFCLWQALGGRLLFWAMLVFSALNFLYAVMQDRWVFPKQFEGYLNYQAQTPFLIPTLRSIRCCVKTFRLFRHHKG